MDALLAQALPLLPTLSTFAFMMVLAAYCWQRRAVPGAAPFALWSLLIAGRAVLSVAAHLFPDPPVLPLLTNVVVATQPIVVAASLAFSLRYTGHDEWLSHRRLPIWLVPVVAFSLLALTNDAHGWMVSEAWFDGYVRVSFAPGGWALVAYSYLLVIASFAVLIEFFVRSPEYRWPVGLIVFALLPPRILAIAPAAGWLSLGMPDPTIVVYNFTGLLCAIALFRFRLFGLEPIARSAAVDQMEDGMLVLDAEGRIGDLNPAAAEILGVARQSARRDEGTRALARHAWLRALCQDPTAARAEVEVETGGASRRYEVRVSPLRDRRGLDRGRMLLFHDLTDLRRAEERMLDQQRALATLEERERLARELHDGLGQVLGYVKLQAQAARELMPQDPGAAATHLSQLIAVAQDAHAEVREYISGAGGISSRSLFTYLQEHLRRFGEHHGIAIELSIPPDLTEGLLAPTVEAQLQGIIQEALNNARKHARASRVRVAFRAEGEVVEVVVEDDGVGFDPDRTPDHLRSDYDGGAGLRFMRERAAEVGGSVALESTPGQGTRVVVKVPCRAKAERTAAVAIGVPSTQTASGQERGD